MPRPRFERERSLTGAGPSGDLNPAGSCAERVRRAAAIPTSGCGVHLEDPASQEQRSGRWADLSSGVSLSSVTLHRLATAGSGPGSCGTSDSQLPGGERVVRRCYCQERRCPRGSLRCKRTPDERNGAEANQHGARDDAHVCEATEVAVFPWRDYELQAGSRGRAPAPSGRGRAGRGVVILCVHRGASRSAVVSAIRPPK